MIDLNTLDEFNGPSDNLNEAGASARISPKGLVPNLDLNYQDDLLTTMLITANVGTIFEEVS